MDIRKKKRVLKPSFSFPHHIFIFKYFVICCSFLVFLLLSWDFRSGRVIIANFPAFPTSVSNSIRENVTSSANTTTSSYNLTSEFRIESRVLFPDHVLVILSANVESPRNLLKLGGKIDCFYHKLWNEYSNEESVSQPMVSADVYCDDEIGTRWIVRCPFPPVNYSAGVGLRARHWDNVDYFDWQLSASENQTVESWDMVAYEAAWDGEDIAAIFVKGLNLRSDKESDTRPFRCRFWLSGGKKESLGLTTMAITASQEVIRCPLPKALKTNLKNKSIIQVSIERRGLLRQEVGSVAKLYPINNKDKKGCKYELCACSMVWNQAPFMREWITYHAWLGVQRWFVYDNNSDDELSNEITDLNSENYNVSRHVWPWIKAQEAGFSHCMLRAKDECNWVAFFDVDEFYYFPPPKKREMDLNLGYPGPNSLVALLKNVSSTNSSVGELRTDCLSYGPSGLKKTPLKGVSIGYTCRMRSPERHKSIVRLDAVNETLFNQVHHFRLKSEFKKKSLLPSIALINHYKYQVWDVFKSKFHRRVSTYVADWQENQNENSKDRAPGLGTEAIEPQDWHLRFCEVWDNRLRDFMLGYMTDSMTGKLTWEVNSMI